MSDMDVRQSPLGAPHLAGAPHIGNCNNPGFFSCQAVLPNAVLPNAVLSVVSLIIGAAYVLNYNPQAIKAAAALRKGKRDGIAVYTPLFISVYILSGLDARFGWSAVPLWLHLLGAVFSLAGPR